LVGSLAVRRSSQAVPAIAKLLDEPDLAAKGMALAALGRIGGEQAVRALTAASPKLPPELKTPCAEALLRCAEGLTAAGNNRQAASILEKLTAPDEASFIRMAAFAARVQALGDKGGDLVSSALTGNDPVLQAAAFRALRASRNARLAQRVAEGLDQLPAPLQLQLLAWLGELGDPSAIAVLSKAASSSTPEVKQAALSALGPVGNASVVPLLATAAAQGTDEDKRLIVESMARLRGADVDGAMIELLAKAPAAQQRELIRALVLRHAVSAVPALLVLAGNKDCEVRAEAVVAVGRLGDQSACDGLLKALVIDPDGAAAAMAEICHREGTVAPLLAGLNKTQGAGKAALLGALDAIGGA
jgi:HEAT repeat protein